MILLDTHIWVWWVNDSDELPEELLAIIGSQTDKGVGVSIISCWEVAKLEEYGRLKLTDPTGQWIDRALAYPGVQLLDLTPPIVVESTRLPGQFHRDPADQMIVATARVYDMPLLTTDAKILNYSYVRTPQNVSEVEQGRRRK